MDFETVGIVAAALLMIPAAVTAEIVDIAQRPALVVRTYNNYGISGEDLRAARDHTKAILNDVGIDVSWVDCGYKNKEPVGAPPSCRQPLALNEVILRIETNGPVAGTRYVSMGFSRVSGNSGGDAPIVSTVFADVVASIARNADVDGRRVLGYAFAHGIGHLLLNNPHHPDAGLMRKTWSLFELQRNRTADWTFRSEEAQTMRTAITARTTIRLGRR